MALIATSIGKPLDRVDGRLKVTGQATYSADTRVPNLAYAALVPSTVATGTIENMDVTAAEKQRGVLAILTHQNAPRLRSQEQKERPGVDPQVGEPLSPLQDKTIRFNGQPIAVVIAESLELAIHAASLVHATYRKERAITDFSVAVAKAFPPREEQAEDGKSGADKSRGDVDRALAAADIHVDATYTIAAEHHNPMEPHATIAHWEGPHLTLWDKTQWVNNVQEQVALAFGMPPTNVRVISPFVGGAFGSALRVWPHVLIAALAARHVRRPVKLVLSREEMFTGTGYRPRTVQRVQLGATRDGELTAIRHSGIGQTSFHEEYTEKLVDPTRFFYACPNVETRYRIAAMNVNSPTSMRGPGEVSGMYALESAMDELAVALHLDPLELRLRNHADIDPESGLPWSSKSLKECYQSAADRFGWKRRNPQPASMHEGGWRMGYGMASATWATLRQPATVLIRIRDDGTAIVRTAASDIGPGTYTALTQIAADALRIPPAKTQCELGDSSLPKAPVQGGSMTIASVGSAVHEAAEKARQQLLKLATADSHSVLRGAQSDEIDAAEGRFFRKDNPGQGETFVEILKRRGQEFVEAVHESKPDSGLKKKFSMHAFGAHFVEVRVDPELGTIKVERVVSAFAAGRIINPKTAHSQAIGGIVGGIGMALHEETHWDPRNGRVVNANFADYHIPVHADIPEIDTVFVEEMDLHVSPLHTKGLAELSIVGVAAAVANAVFHATGRRIRDLPIKLDKLL